MSALDRLHRFRKRNEGAVARKAVHDMLARAWMRPSVRRIARLPFRPRQPRHWIFAAGCYNSGTTILREILGAHPEIASLPREGVRMTDAFPELEAKGWKRMWHRNAELAALDGYDPASVAERAMRDWAPWWARGADIFFEKSIVHGSWMPFLQDAFTDSRFVFVVRNGFCAAEGILRRARPGSEAATILGRETYPPAEAARQWVVSNEAWLRDQEKLKNAYEFRYETFVADPGRVVREMLDFVGADSEPFRDYGDGRIEMGDRPFTIRNENTASLARLDDNAHDEIAGVIAPTMTRLGYDMDRYTK